jgi:hypothetical protein
MISRKDMLLMIILVILICNIEQSFSFHVQQPPSTSRQTSLYAKKNANQKQSTGGFGGFGSKPVSTSAKTRSVSGYSGSGTKPLREAANTFDLIRKKYGKESTSDLYMRSPLNDSELFWFIGKVNRRLEGDEYMEGSVSPTEMETVLSQKRLIIEYAKNQLRPQNFGGPYSSNLEIWLAPGDSEMDVVQNKISLVKVTGSIKGRVSM